MILPTSKVKKGHITSLWLRMPTAERINGILKSEFLIHKCNTGKELKVLIKESIETYNNQRPHLSLNFKTPKFIHEKTCEQNSTGFT